MTGGRTRRDQQAGQPGEAPRVDRERECRECVNRHRGLPSCLPVSLPASRYVPVLG